MNVKLSPSLKPYLKASGTFLHIYDIICKSQPFNQPEIKILICTKGIAEWKILIQ